MNLTNQPDSQPDAPCKNTRPPSPEHPTQADTDNSASLPPDTTPPDTAITRKKRRLTRRHLLTALPALGAAGLGLGFARMLHKLDQGSFDPHAINIPRTGRAVPDFPPLPALPGLPAIPGLSRQDFRDLKQPVLLLAWASWCLPCMEELPTLHQLATLMAARQDNEAPSLALWGLCYKDQPEPALRFLARAGQPFSRLGMDMTGRSAIDWGMSGVPESFLILPGTHKNAPRNAQGDTQGDARIVWHGTASLSMEDYQNHIRPHLEATP